MSAQPPDPRAGWAGPIRCPRCSAEVGADQDWCLECGAPARTRLAATPNWRLPTAVLAVVLAIAGAALAFAFVQLTDDDPVTPAATAPAAAAPPQPAQPAPTPTAPPVTSTLATPTITAPAPGATQPPPAAVPGQTAPPTTGTQTTPRARTTPRTQTTPPEDQGSAPLP